MSFYPSVSLSLTVSFPYRRSSITKRSTWLGSNATAPITENEKHHEQLCERHVVVDIRYVVRTHVFAPVIMNGLSEDLNPIADNKTSPNVLHRFDEKTLRFSLHRSNSWSMAACAHATAKAAAMCSAIAQIKGLVAAGRVAELTLQSLGAMFEAPAAAAVIGERQQEQMTDIAPKAADAPKAVATSD